MKKAIPVAATIAAAIIGYGVYRWIRGGGDGAIRVSGNIELTEVDISFKLPGKLVERPVDEGDAVKRGMLLAKLDQEQLMAQRDRAKAALEAAESLRDQVATSVELQRETLEAQIQQRAAEVRAMEARLEELTSGSREEEKKQARAAVDRARAEADRAQKDFERMESLFKSDNISAADLDQYRARRDSAAAALREVQQQYQIVIDGPRRETIEAARAQLAQARATLRLAEAQRLELKRRQEELRTREADIGQRRAELALIESQLADTIAISPIDGVVLAKGAEPGEVIAAGTTVLTVGDIEHPWLRAYISETDLGRVKIGSAARVTTDSFPGKVYKGRVSFIASQAEFTPKQIQTFEERAKLMYRIKIDVENPNGELKSNMPADAEIIP
ncbi:MAG: HlyD family secretion protein [bacterium]|jgi:HlyD family secretion protein